MSKVSLAGNASGTGIFTIASPNSNTDRTLTLPDSTGTLLNSSSSIAIAQLPKKMIAQMIVSGNTIGVSSGFTTTSTTPVSIGASVSITPLFSNSTIVYMATLNSRVTSGVSYFDIYVNGTLSAYSGRPNGNAGTIGKASSASQTHWQQCIGASFAPGTTATQTYDLRLSTESASTAEIWNYGPVNIVVYEVTA
jgi:hypothetical protein